MLSTDKTNTTEIAVLSNEVKHMRLAVEGICDLSRTQDGLLRSCVEKTNAHQILHESHTENLKDISKELKKHGVIINRAVGALKLLGKILGMSAVIGAVAEYFSRGGG